MTACSVILSLGVTGVAQGATIGLKDGKVLSGEIVGHRVFKRVESQNIIYTIVRGDRITTIDREGIHCDQPPPERRGGRTGDGERASVRTIRIGSTGNAVTTASEQALLRGVVSDDFATLMKSLMAFRVQTGSGVDQSDDFETRLVAGPLQGTLDSASGVVAPAIRLRTASGETAVAIADVVSFRQQ